jgi:hypothetical protein
MNIENAKNKASLVMFLEGGLNDWGYTTGSVSLSNKVGKVSEIRYDFFGMQGTMVIFIKMLSGDVSIVYGMPCYIETIKPTV